MQFKQLTPELYVSGQLLPADIAEVAAQGIKTIICNRPDAESSDQPSFVEMEEEAARHGIDIYHLPVISGQVTDNDAQAMETLLDQAVGPALAYCRTGTRSTQLWALSQALGGEDINQLRTTARSIGYDVYPLLQRFEANFSKAQASKPAMTYELLIVGGGAAGIAAASSLLSRHPDLQIGIIDPAEHHYYQPGWTLVGGGVFTPEKTERQMSSLIPRHAHWIKAAVTSFEPEQNRLMLEDNRIVQYRRLIVAPGLKLNWEGVEGLAETLGHNGVTSNYRYDLAPYTWQLVQQLKTGKAIFTQPPMPIKCAGAPQKAMYLSADHWRRTGVLNNIDIQFYNAGGVLFGVKDYVPALMEYVERYNAKLNFSHNLVKIDGSTRTAWFEHTKADGEKEVLSTEFDMIHVCPPQQAPDFIRRSSLADDAGWVDVDQNTLRHKRYENIWSLGDAMNAPNAKTAAAARMQAPVVANNVLQDMGLGTGVAHYNGYGSCPLTVEKGKIVLAEFGYGGKLLPTFPTWVLDGKRPTRTAWILKERILPPVYWEAMLKGKEWLTKPTVVE
ncbi:bifunctional protein tyrosine phosphatase family protein/NAD(P)/FAD-dependent oxidoreductase [Hahella ganghwensis]|uniref:bifunctional protein tyrosine phosphatase family protein/NAD(P)/FAD-dependent oxidoreductase n=1 Tax=Hahella ganghwensis TaxID=286420 RepID=UPI00037D3127|nr:bifunctional protein tyrosine phosphatase family protein/NAD(P)/FAD-dependent oxidoreductase [Hahella ganghwensis]